MTNFNGNGLSSAISSLTEEIQSLYLEDQIPWVIGYSGGKDSTAITQLVWDALADLKKDKIQLHKEVHIICTDTLVENPIVSQWVELSINLMNEKAKEDGLPITAHLLKPKVEDTFWTNFIGKGYPAPRINFRWCTDRLKIKPVNDFIKSVIKQKGEAIILLGTRKAESSARAGRLNKLEKERRRILLNNHMSLGNAYTYAPIVDWSNDDVWLYLMQIKNSWGHNNKELLNMYQGATKDGECPIVMDTSTPSCGDSRFGCWICTMVNKDKSMMAMVQNDAEKEWMEPLLSFRDKISDKEKEKSENWRDFRRMDGNVYLANRFKAKEKITDKVINGPYTQETREKWLFDILTIENIIHENPNAPEYVRNLTLITMDELHAIREIWLTKKHELEDNLPVIYEKVKGVKFPSKKIGLRSIFRKDELDILKECSDGNEWLYKLNRDLLDIQVSYRTSTKKMHLFDNIEKAIKKNFYEDEEEAVKFAVMKKDYSSAIKSLTSDDMTTEQIIELAEQYLDN